MVPRPLTGARVQLRPPQPSTAADAVRLYQILVGPEATRWWGPTSEADCAEMLDDPAVDSWFVELDGQVVGFIQCAEVADPDYRSAGIDVVLDDDWRGKGLGTDAVRTLARHLVDDRGHHRLTIDPAAANVVAIACYTKVGFRPVGVMRRYERGHDGLLMDLLAEELSR